MAQITIPHAPRAQEWRAYHDETGAVTNHSIKAAPDNSSDILYVTDIIITNDSTAAITVKFVTDTTGTPVQLTGTYKIPASGGMVLNLIVPLKASAGKDLGFTAAGTSNYCVEVHGFTARVN